MSSTEVESGIETIDHRKRKEHVKGSHQKRRLILLINHEMCVGISLMNDMFRAKFLFIKHLQFPFLLFEIDNYTQYSFVMEDMT